MLYYCEPAVSFVIELNRERSGEEKGSGGCWVGLIMIINKTSYFLHHSINTAITLQLKSEKTIIVLLTFRWTADCRLQNVLLLKAVLARRGRFGQIM